MCSVAFLPRRISEQGELNHTHLLPGFMYESKKERRPSFATNPNTRIEQSAYLLVYNVRWSLQCCYRNPNMWAHGRPFLTREGTQRSTSLVVLFQHSCLNRGEEGLELSSASLAESFFIYISTPLSKVLTCQLTLVRPAYMSLLL
jgi:hypothetical protein